jgi:enediyne biosynthesis protein E4
MKHALLVAIASATAAAAEPATSGWFENVTARAGVERPHTNRRFENPYAHIMSGYTALGASVSVGDFDDDGFEDLFVTDSAAGSANHLYRNNGDWTFTDVAARAGVAAGNDEANASADSLFFDFDADGLRDLFVVRFGRSQLFRNRGDGTFQDVTSAAGLTAYHNAITAIAFDYDRDSDLDLLVGSYFRPVNIFNPDTPRFFPESFETANNGGGVTLYRNDGGRTFTDVTAAAGLTSSGWVLDVGHADADGDGDDDVYVAADFGTDRFYVNNGNGTFTDRTVEAIGIDTKKGMNAEWGDFDGDLRPDVYVTNITDDYMREGNFLWRNNGDLTFTDVSRETGTWDTGWGWGGQFFDYDHDGWLDLYVMNGWVSAGKESYVPDIFAMIVKPNIDLADLRNWPPMGSKSLSGYQKKRLFHNEGGQSFTDHAARHGLDSMRDGRGVAIVDLDNDGRLDLFVANANGMPFLYRNRMPDARHWVELVLRGSGRNRSSIGAQVIVTAGGRSQWRFVSGGNGFAAQGTTRVHVGLGDAETIDRIDVRWPSGARQAFNTLPVNRIHVLSEGQPHAAPLRPVTVIE